MIVRIGKKEYRVLQEYQHGDSMNYRIADWSMVEKKKNPFFRLQNNLVTGTWSLRAETKRGLSSIIKYLPGTCKIEFVVEG